MAKSRISNTSDIGSLVQRVRKSQQLSQQELAGACGLGTRFISDLEKGKPTCQIGKVLLVISMLGIKLETHEPVVQESPSHA